MGKLIIQFFVPLIFLLLVTSLTYSQSKKLPSSTGVNRHSGKLLTDPSQSLMDINNVTSWTGSDGYHDWIVGGSWNGAYPNGTFIGSIFSEGILWGGKVNDGTSPLVRVNGNTYGSGCAAVTRLYRVRPNYATVNLTSDASNFFNEPISDVTEEQIQQLRSQYQKDWNEWPANEGGAFKDVDEDGQYDPSVDIPGIPGASQTLFIKYNDDQIPLYGSPQIGLDVSETYWAYANGSQLGNVIFKKIDIHYGGIPGAPSDSFIDSMYICQWADPDIGDALNDFAGCDTTLNLGFAYNAASYDAIYSDLGLYPPAAGYTLLQGVSEFTGNNNDSSIINFSWRHGYRFIYDNPLNSFMYFSSGGGWSDPIFDYSGTLEFYNMMRGFQPDPPYPDGIQFPSEVAVYSGRGVYLLPGDPVTGSGLIDGVYDGSGDRRIFLVHGPFNLQYGKTAEIVVALVAGLGTSNLSSITNMKANAVSASSSFLELVQSGQVQIVSVKTDPSNNKIQDFILNQNYPNPFNPTTTIKFSIPSVGVSLVKFVQLKVYDVLGNDVATLVNEEKAAGEYTVTFDASKLSSGIYFYQLKTGSLIKTKKMILLK